MSRKQHVPVTIIDVAREAAVSPKTVSRVVNGDHYVSQKTQERVQNAINQLGYSPNRLARSLVSNKSTVIGIVIPDINNPFFPEVVRGIEDTALERGYNVLLFSTEGQLDRERAAYRILEENRVDGVIIYFPFIPDTELETILMRQKATILIDHYPLTHAAGVIRVDFYDAAVQAVNHLVAAGRRTLSYLSPSEPYYTYTERLRGIAAATALTETPILPQHFAYCASTLEDSYRAARDLLSNNPSIDGMVCFNDIVGIGALEACDDLGIVVPDQVAIIGFDDIRLAGLNRIALTTLRVPKFEIGVQAIHMLCNYLDVTGNTTEVVLKTELIQRRTTPTLAHKQA